MSRPAQIKFLSRCAAAYDPIVQLMGFASLWRRLAAVAAPEPGQRVLDVCTGTGGAAFDLMGHGARVVGVDLAAGMLRHARRKQQYNGSGPQFVRMDARRLAFPDRSFSLVTCAMALHEMAETERQEVLREMVRVARHRVVIADYRVPDTRLSSVLFRLRRAYEYVESDDFTQFVAHDFAARLAHVGLTVETAHDVGGFRIWRCLVRCP